MSVAEVSVKFRNNARLALSDESVERLEHRVLALEHQRDVREVFAELRRTVNATRAPSG